MFYWIVLWHHFTTAFTRLLRKLNSNFLHRRRKSLIRNGDWLRLIKAHHKNQNIRDKSCGKQGSSLHEICYTFLFRNWFVTQNNPIVKFNPVSSSATLIYDVSSLRDHPTSPDVTTSYPAKWSPISASDWSCRDGNLLQSIVGTTQIEIVNQLPPQALVFRIVEASAKREWLVMNRKRRWEGSPVVSFPPSFAFTFLSRERRLGTRQVVTRHQFEISVFVSQTSFRGKPVVGSRNVGCFLKLLFSPN